MDPPARCPTSHSMGARMVSSTGRQAARVHFSANQILFFHMIFTAAPLSGAYVIDLEPFSDERGWFARTYCKNEFSQIGHTKEWVQLNQSVSYTRGTLRGMHFQNAP